MRGWLIFILIVLILGALAESPLILFIGWSLGFLFTVIVIAAIVAIGWVAIMFLIEFTRSFNKYLHDD